MSWRIQPMRTLLSIAIQAAIIGLAVLPTNQASACWCNRVYTRYYVDPCVSCSGTPQYSTLQSSCQASCYTACAQSCYVEPQVGYRIMTRLEPQMFYVRRSSYDPLSCSERSYYYPATQLIEREYQVPVTTYVSCCYTEPSSCSTFEPARNGNQSDEDTPAPKPAERINPELDRPIYRENVPKSDPPKPVPMPSPQASRGRSMTYYA